LFVGKQVGVTLACMLAVATGIASLPPGVGWMRLHGVAILTGIGFTMSLFIGTLAFPDSSQDVATRLGVLTGSVVSAVAGFIWLRWLAPVAVVDPRRRRD
jgi:NhaA family Na+:H+ antiporter